MMQLTTCKGCQNERVYCECMTIKPTCPNCGQWQHEKNLGGLSFLDCLHDCAERGLAPRNASVEDDD